MTDKPLGLTKNHKKCSSRYFLWASEANYTSRFWIIVLEYDNCFILGVYNNEFDFERFVVDRVIPAFIANE